MNDEKDAVHEKIMRLTKDNYKWDEKGCIRCGKEFDTPYVNMHPITITNKFCDVCFLEIWSPEDYKSITKEEKPVEKKIDSMFEIKRGYFGIGIYEGKSKENIGTLWRSAYQLGAAFVFTIGERYGHQRTDTIKSIRHIPLFHFDTLGDFMNRGVPDNCEIIGIEMGGKNIVGVNHPERAVYVLGAEDRGLSEEMMDACDRLIEIPCVRTPSYNVAVTGSIVMYDRLAKAIR